MELARFGHARNCFGAAKRIIKVARILNRTGGATSPEKGVAKVEVSSNLEESRSLIVKHPNLAVLALILDLAAKLGAEATPLDNATGAA